MSKFQFQDDKNLDYYELYTLADFYALDSLRVLSREELEHAAPTNALPSMLALADRHGDTDFAMSVAWFIGLNLKEVMKTEGWREMVETNPALMEKVLKELQ